MGIQTGEKMIRLQTVSFRFAEQVLDTYTVTTRHLQTTMIKQYNQKWDGSLTFEWGPGDTQLL